MKRKEVWVVLEDEQQGLINFLYVVLSVIIFFTFALFFTRSLVFAFVGGSLPFIAIYFLHWERNVPLSKAVGIVSSAAFILLFILALFFAYKWLGG